MKIQAYNPYLPSYEYIPDGEPHVFGDRLYIFGSHDCFNGGDYCMNDYVCWSTPVDDLSDWRYEGVIYRKDQHPHQGGKPELYAPDVAQGPDGRYYLYYSKSDSGIISVAVCDTPAGLYQYYGDVKDNTGHVMGSAEGDLWQFDPAVLVDDDNRVYLYSGSNSYNGVTEMHGRKIAGAIVMELDSDMLTVIAGPNVIMGPKKEDAGGHDFYEGSSIRKFNGLYYFIYFAINISGLNYCTSQYPDKEFVYRGVIHSSSDLGLNGRNFYNAAYPVGNSHGSIELVNGQYYIFDHRMTNRNQFSRQAVAEPIHIQTDGSIDQVESTSCGLNGGPLRGLGEYPAYIVCNLIHHPMEGAYLTQEGEDSEEVSTQYLASLSNGNIAGFKYFEFDKVSRISVQVRGEASGCLRVLLGEEAQQAASIPLDLHVQEWTSFSGELNITPGIHPLFFIYEGTGSFDMIAFTIL